MKKARQLFLLFGDFLILNLALAITIFIRYRIIGQDSSGLKRILEIHQGPFAIVFLIWLLCFYVGGLYKPSTLANTRSFNRNALSVIAVASIFSVIFFYLRASEITPKTTLFIFIIVFTIIFLPWRRFYNILLKSYLPRNKVIFIGESLPATKLREQLDQTPQFGWKNEGFVASDDISKLSQIVLDKGIKTIILNDRIVSEEAQQALFDCLKLKVNFYSFPHFYELVTGKIPVEEIDRSWFLENLNEGKRKYYNIFKKTYDLISATLALAISLPFWPIIALLIRIDSRGPIFFTQRRLGENEEVFKMLKFRTMKVAGNTGLMTAENDPRITKIGNFLRKTRVDEIPQLLNILKGDMSFIGPRPERPELVVKLAERVPFYKTRLLVKPGITGWDQVSGIYHSPSFEDTLEKLQYDLFYLKHRSPYLDLTIVLKTIATVLSKGGR
ncbi:MAG: sugar transferase [Patescibacteria group bacterium]